MSDNSTDKLWHFLERIFGDNGKLSGEHSIANDLIIIFTILFLLLVFSFNSV